MPGTNRCSTTLTLLLSPYSTELKSVQVITALSIQVAKYSHFNYDLLASVITLEDDGPQGYDRRLLATHGGWTGTLFTFYFQG